MFVPKKAKQGRILNTKSAFQLGPFPPLSLGEYTNVEMAEEMGEENMFIFGLDVEGVDALKAAGYDAKKYYNANPELARIVDQIRGGAFSPGDRKDEFDDLINALMNHDRFLTLADFDAYIACQDRVDQAYEVSQLNTFLITLWSIITFQNSSLWAKMSICNIASSGKFSSDRTIAEYAREIWGVEPTWEKLPDPHAPVEQ